MNTAKRLRTTLGPLAQALSECGDGSKTQNLEIAIAELQSVERGPKATELLEIVSRLDDIQFTQTAFMAMLVALSAKTDPQIKDAIERLANQIPPAREETARAEKKTGLSLLADRMKENRDQEARPSSELEKSERSLSDYEREH